MGITYEIMNLQKIILAAMSAISLFSCVPESESLDQTQYGERLELTASWADDAGSRTSIVVDGNTGHILWSPEERINVFFGAKSSGIFTSTNTEPQAIATFTGTLNTVIGGMEMSNPTMSYWAIYPYNEANSCEGQSVTLSLSQFQTGEADSFCNNLFPAIARGESLNLSFYNVCGGICFSTIKEGVETVVFKSNDGSPMTGTVNVGFGEDNRPKLMNILDAKDSVVVKAPQGGFIPGTRYFATVLPQTHSQGIKVSLYTSTQKATRHVSGNVSVDRAVFGVLDKMDEGLTYSDYFNPYSNIIFADSRIKASCVAAFDTNGDGEISYDEAGAVTDISTAFTSTLYTSFDEFRYFTGVTEIPALWMKDRARLTSIALPKSISKIGSGAFVGCTGIRRLELGGPLIQSVTMSWILPSTYTSFSECVITADEPYSICKEAFSGCTGLQSVVFAEGLSKIESDAFKGCSQMQRVCVPSILCWLKTTFGNAKSAPFNGSEGGDIYIGEDKLQNMVIPQGRTNITSYAFLNCNSLCSVNLPEELTRLGKSSFSGCTSLESIIIPSTLMKIQASAFSGCTKLKVAHVSNLVSWINIDFDNVAASPFNASGEGHLYVGETELTEPLIPEDVTAFKQYAFYNCTGFSKMILEPLVPPSLGTDVVTGTRCFYIVWDECLTKYKSEWSSFQQRIFSVSEGLPEIVDEYVDLGLSVKWASGNIGAYYYWEYGDLFAWGETEPKDVYTWDTYKWHEGGGYGLTKYCNEPSFGYNRFTDGKLVLDPEDDAATVILGSSWRMPTWEEWEELITNCTFEWTTLYGILGTKVVSKVPGYTGNWLFFPAAHYGYNDREGNYWSSSLKKRGNEEGHSDNAYRAHFSISGSSFGRYPRCTGMSIRPVKKN